MNTPSLSAVKDTAPSVKELPYAIAEKTSSEVSGGGVVGRGVNRKSGDPFLIYQDGRTQQAIPLRAVAAAVFSGTVTREEIAELHALADKASKAPGK